MRFADVFGPALVLMALVSSLCQAQDHSRPAGSRRRIASVESPFAKTLFSNFTASAQISWRQGPNCYTNSRAFLTASELARTVDTNEKAENSTYDDVIVLMSLLSQCKNSSYVLTYIELIADDPKADPGTTITIDAKLNFGKIKTTPNYAYVRKLSCDRALAADTEPTDHEPCGCEEISSGQESVTFETKLKAIDKAMPSKYSSSYRDSYGGYDYRFTGTSRDAVVVYMKVKLQNGSVINIPVSGSYGTLGRADGGESYFAP